MDSSKDIYHKADSSIPPRRKGRVASEPFVRSVPSTDAASSSPGATPLGTQHIGAPISPVQIARQQMQMNPSNHVRRRRRRRDPAGEIRTRRYNRVVWLLVILVILSYLAVLAGRFWNEWRNPRPSATKVSPTPTNAPARQVADPARATSGGQPAAERVREWSKGLRALEDARTFLNSGRLPLAKEKLKIAADALPNSPEQLLGNARIALGELDFVAAEELLMRAVDADPTNREARELLARALLENNRYADALAVAEWICTLDPYSESARETAANAALAAEVNDAPKAIEHLKKLATLRSDDLTVKNNLGKAYLRTGDFVGARRIYEEMLKADDMNSAALYQLAVCQVKQNKPDEAIATLNRAAAKLDVNFVSTWLGSADFSTLREMPEFIALQRRIGNTPGSP